MRKTTNTYLHQRRQHTQLLHFPSPPQNPLQHVSPFRLRRRRNRWLMRCGQKGAKGRLEPFI